MHYKVEFENDQVRVLHIIVGPRESTPMHSHPASVLVWITDSHVRFTYRGGKTAETRGKAGQAAWSDPVTHEGVNLSDGPSVVYQIELKTKPRAVKPTKRKSE